PADDARGADRAPLRDLVGLAHVDERGALLLERGRLPRRHLGDLGLEIGESVVLRSHREPPATAGTMDRTAPSAGGACRPCRLRTSLDPTYTLTNARTFPSLSRTRSRIPGHRSPRFASASWTLDARTRTSSAPFVNDRSGVGIRIVVSLMSSTPAPRRSARPRVARSASRGLRASSLRRSRRTSPPKPRRGRSPTARPDGRG